MAIYNNNM